MVLDNDCGANIAPDAETLAMYADRASRPEKLMMAVIMKGRNATDLDEFRRVYGSCDYLPPDHRDLGRAGGLQAGWHCHFYVYRVDSGVRQRSYDDPTLIPAYGTVSLPLFTHEDIRGLSGAESWFGTKPQLTLESERELVIDEFGIEGPGQLRFSCPSDIVNGGKIYDMKDCRVSWRNTAMPEKVYFAATCGESVVVPGIFVAVEK